MGRVGCVWVLVWMCVCACVGGCESVRVMGGWKGRHTPVHAFLSAGFFPVLEESVGECCDHPQTQACMDAHTQQSMSYIVKHPVLSSQATHAHTLQQSLEEKCWHTISKIGCLEHTHAHRRHHTHSCWSSLVKYWKYSLTWSLTSDSGCAIHFSWHSHTSSCLLKRIGKYEVEWTVTDRNQKEFIAVGIACKAIWPASGLKQ